MKMLDFSLNKRTTFEQKFEFLQDYWLDKNKLTLSNIGTSVGFQMPPRNLTSASRQPQNGHFNEGLILHLLASSEAVLRQRPVILVGIDSPWVGLHLITWVYSAKS